jgi:hypothetical protein
MILTLGGKKHEGEAFFFYIWTTSIGLRKVRVRLHRPLGGPLTLVTCKLLVYYLHISCLKGNGKALSQPRYTICRQLQTKNIDISKTRSMDILTREAVSIRSNTCEIEVHKHRYPKAISAGRRTVGPIAVAWPLAINYKSFIFLGNNNTLYICTVAKWCGNLVKQHCNLKWELF